MLPYFGTGPRLEPASDDIGKVVEGTARKRRKGIVGAVNVGGPMILRHLFGNWGDDEIAALMYKCKGTWFCTRIVYAAISMIALGKSLKYWECKYC